MNSSLFLFRVRGGLPPLLLGALLAVALVVRLSAAEKFTPVTLSGWTATDGVTTPGDRGKGLVIPAGAQLSRLFPAGQVQVQLSTRPYFSSAPGGWASLEIGPVSLTFVRNADGGGMVLLGDELLELPFDLPLNAEGRSQAALEFTLSFNQGQGLAALTFQQRTFEVAATTPPGPIEVALSAGGIRVWEIEKIAIKASASVVAPAGSGGGAQAPQVLSAAAPGNRDATLKGARDQARSLFRSGDDVAAEKVLTGANRNPANTPEWHLESANALVQMAFSLARAGQPEKVVRLAYRALQHTEKASRKAARQPGQETLVTAADELAALIQEKLLADYKGAREFYLKAALRRPQGGAEGALNRLEKAAKEAERKGAARGR